jgi:hypothetical protein
MFYNIKLSQGVVQVSVTALAIIAKVTIFAIVFKSDGDQFYWLM